MNGVINRCQGVEKMLLFYLLGPLYVKMANLMILIFHADERTKVFHEVSHLTSKNRRVPKNNVKFKAFAVMHCSPPPYGTFPRQFLSLFTFAIELLQISKWPDG